ncbi:Alcohol dehydrogenase GroES domain protein (plasmid) [Rhizobium leguminosarum bv. trifolii WSM2304]|uniref:Alcohol dehydrogenase GroES domain protein n=2 Tax=Rhizobium leguminosarum TaxID=384 RepID=A0ABF7QZM5_RHILW|nr:Alcohol dehydrogenase GroES domain protein [Rhizobium leguminosarum bv. trifolii WSM2304]
MTEDMGLNRLGNHMKRIQYHRYGGPDVMQMERFEPPALRPDDIAVKVVYAAINPVDWKVRRGDLKLVTGRKFPRAMGCDFSGEILAVGSGVTAFKLGEAVFGVAPVKTCGALAEVVVAPQTVVGRKPESVTFEEAACLGTPGVTAWNALIDKAHLKAGQHVLINGCTGAVGAAAVQIALLQGAIVSGTCSADAATQAKALGVTEVLDYRKTNLATLSRRFDVVFDTAITMPIATGLCLLSRGGVFLDLEPGPAKIIRSLFDRRLKPIICTPRPAIMAALAEAARVGRLSVPSAQIVDFDAAIGKIANLEQGVGSRGKAVVAIGTAV